MCGIAGKFNYRSVEPVDPALLSRMAASIAHRGPDDEGFFTEPDMGVGFAHRRLSIIDLNTGHQPMSNPAEDLWIIFNGEIYNFPELKKELIERGRIFRTTSDTEVILSLYEEQGERAFARLNGIFAFALYDKRKNCVLLARDHFGVKPLYYSLDDQRVVFGSEIKAILQDTCVARELDYEAFNSFLTFRYNPSPHTLFKSIRKLQPGHYLKIEGRTGASLHSYWDYIPRTNQSISEEEATVEYQRLLEAAVRRQMLSDVPVGLLLSGGIDSAIIGWLMQQETTERIKTFAVGFGGAGDYNELDDARVTATLIGSEHHELVISQKQYMDFFFQSFYYTEEPIAEPTIPALYYVSRLAAKHLKVVLAGQGADEPLAGYHRYLGEKYISRFGGVLALLPLNTIASLFRRNERLKRAAFAAQFTAEHQRFLALYTIFTPELKRQILTPDTQRMMMNADEALVQRLHTQTDALTDSLSRLLFMDTRMSLSDDLLLFGDKMSMANSLEIRVPFLDVELIRFVESLPGSLKLRGTTRKYIHKKATAKWLPREIIYRKKRGFATPMDEWLRSDLAGFVRTLLNKPDAACRNYFDLGVINRMIDEHLSRKENCQRHIFALMSFELWHKSFFEKTIADKEFTLHEH